MSSQKPAPPSPFPKDVASCHVMLEGLFQTLAESQQRIEQLETAVDQLIRQRTGPKSERCHAVS